MVEADVVVEVPGETSRNVPPTSKVGSSVIRASKTDVDAEIMVQESQGTTVGDDDGRSNQVIPVELIDTIVADALRCSRYSIGCQWEPMRGARNRQRQVVGTDVPGDIHESGCRSIIIRTTSTPFREETNGSPIRIADQRPMRFHDRHDMEKRSADGHSTVSPKKT